MAEWRGKHAGRISKWGQPARESFRSWLHRLVRHLVIHAVTMREQNVRSLVLLGQRDRADM